MRQTATTASCYLTSWNCITPPIGEVIGTNCLVSRGKQANCHHTFSPGCSLTSRDWVFVTFIEAIRTNWCVSRRRREWDELPPLATVIGCLILNSDWVPSLLTEVSGSNCLIGKKTWRKKSDNLCVVHYLADDLWLGEQAQSCVKLPFILSKHYPKIFRLRYLLIPFNCIDSLLQ